MRYCRDIGCGFVLAIIILVLWLPRLRGPIDLRWDAGVYYILGTSLAEGQGYRLLNEPGLPEAVQYPPLLPGIVALHQIALGTRDPAVVAAWLRLTSFAVFTTYAAAAYILGRSFLGPFGSLLTAAISITYLHAVFLSDLLLTEIPFGLTTALFVVSSRRMRGWAGWVVPSGLLWGTILLRVSGVALGAAWIVDRVLNRDSKAAIVHVIVVLIPLGAWQLYVSKVKSSPSYEKGAYAYQRADYQFYNVPYFENILLRETFTPSKGKVTPSELAMRVGDHAAATPIILAEGVMGGRDLLSRSQEGRLKVGPLRVPYQFLVCAFGALGFLVAAGQIWLFWRGERVVPLNVLGSLLLMYLTPWGGQFARYLTPLTPSLALGLVGIASSVWSGRGKAEYRIAWLSRGLVLAVLGAILAKNVVSLRPHLGPLYRDAVRWPGGLRELEHGAFNYDATWEAYRSAIAWLATHARPGEVVAAVAPHQVFLEAGLPSVLPPMEADSRRNSQLLDSVPVNYAILDHLGFLDVMRRYVGPLVREHPKDWELVYRDPGRLAEVYRRVRR